MLALFTGAALAACLDFSNLSDDSANATDGGGDGSDASTGDTGTSSDSAISNDGAPPSCAGGGGGVCAGGDCCESPIVPGGPCNRRQDGGAPATITDFRMDRFKATVGRFRAFVQAGAATQASPPLPGVGAHPKIPGSGWDPAWNPSLHATTAAVIASLHCDANATWTDAPGANESLPIGCVDWYLAFAFCAWDGGRLPTETEWDYVAMAGAEHRFYPWSNPPGSTFIDHSYALYECGHDGGATNSSCPIADITPPGAFSPKGDGKWGQADLVGSFLEWQLDWGAGNGYITPCTDCGRLSDDFEAGARSDRPYGDLAYTAGQQNSFNRNSDPPTSSFATGGVRCARAL